VAVYVCVTPVDMRKQGTTLALIVEQALKQDGIAERLPFSQFLQLRTEIH